MGDITRKWFNSSEGRSSVREVDVQRYSASQSVERDISGCRVGRNSSLSLCPSLPKDLLLGAVQSDLVALWVEPQLLLS